MRRAQGPQILAALAPEQRVEALREPFPRRRLGKRILLLLWALRLYVIVAVPLVLYAFVRALTK